MFVRGSAGRALLPFYKQDTWRERARKGERAKGCDAVLKGGRRTTQVPKAGLEPRCQHNTTHTHIFIHIVVYTTPRHAMPHVPEWRQRAVLDPNCSSLRPTARAQGTKSMNLITAGTDAQWVWQWVWHRDTTYPRPAGVIHCSSPPKCHLPI